MPQFRVRAPPHGRPRVDRHDAALGPLSQRAHDDFLVAYFHVVADVVEFREPRLVGRLAVEGFW